MFLYIFFTKVLRGSLLNTSILTIKIIFMLAPIPKRVCIYKRFQKIYICSLRIQRLLCCVSLKCNSTPYEIEGNCVYKRQSPKYYSSAHKNILGSI